MSGGSRHVATCPEATSIERHSIVSIDNRDNMCLPRPIAVILYSKAVEKVVTVDQCPDRIIKLEAVYNRVRRKNCVSNPGSNHNLQPSFNQYQETMQWQRNQTDRERFQNLYQSTCGRSISQNHLWWHCNEPKGRRTGAQRFQHVFPLQTLDSWDQKISYQCHQITQRVFQEKTLLHFLQQRVPTEKSSC